MKNNGILAVIICVTLLAAAGILYTKNSTPPLPNQDQSISNSSTAPPAQQNAQTGLHDPSMLNTAQAADNTPQPEKPSRPEAAAKNDTDEHTAQGAELHVISSSSPDDSDWKGVFDAGIRSRQVSLDPAMIHGQPLAEGTLLTLALFDDVTVQATVSNSFANVNDTISTTAKLQGSEYGRVFIASTGGEVHARIRIPEEGKIYSIQFNQRTGHHYALELNSRLAEPDEGNDQRYIPILPSDSVQGKTAATSDAPLRLEDEVTDQYAVVDIMVVYTDDALTAAGSVAAMNNSIAIGVSSANDAHANTGSFIIWQLIYSYEETYTETGDMAIDHDRLTFSSTYDPWNAESSHGAYMLDNVHTQRDNYGADFVILMNATGSGGLAWVLSTTNGDPTISPFSVVDDNSFLGYTPAHEVGHNMGLSHAKDQNFQAGPTDWSTDGYGFGTTTAGWHWHPTPGADGYCSVMTYTSGSYFADGLNHIRVGVFSDPNISDHGMPTGDATNGDSAGVLRQLRHVYAGYRSRLSSTSILVDYPDGGEQLVAGETYTILWDSLNVTGEVKIELLQNGSLDQVIDPHTLNDRAYLWTVPAATSGTGYAIRVSNLTGTITDTSNATFSISKVFYDEPLDSNPSYTTSGSWEYGVPVAINNVTYGGPGAAYTDTNIYDTNLDGASWTDSYLTTGSIDCSGYTNVTLSFMGQFSVSDTDYAKVQVSNNGTNWTDLYSATNLWATGWSEYTYDISSVADGQSTVYIRWFNDDSTPPIDNFSRSGMSVDDIQLSGILVPSGPTVTLGISPASIVENGGVATITATLSEVHTSAVTVNLAFSGTATNASDYNASSSSITVGTGSISNSITITGIDDSSDESNETIIIDISSVTNGTENGTQQGTTTLIDNDYTVTYNANGATSGTAPSSQTKVGGANLTLANNYGNLAKIGYSFAGWNTMSNGTGTTYGAGGTYSTDASITLYAKWNALPTYTVTYNANGATSGSVPTSQTKIQGINLTLATNYGNLAKIGYSFEGWNTSLNGTGTDYTEGATYSVDASITLYAKWALLPTYPVHYHTNGATSGTAPSSQTKIEGINLVLAGNVGNLAKNGFNFAGWNTAPDGNGTNYVEGAIYLNDATITLYAKWTTLPTYTVTYNANGATSGTVPTSQTKTDGFDLILAGNTGNLEKTGFPFVGWNTTPDGKGTDYVAGGQYSDNADVTLYVKWEKNKTGFWNLVLPAILNNGRGKP